MSTKLILLLVLLTGCSSAPVIEKLVPVEVERVRFVPLAPDLLAPCLSKPDRLKDGITVGMLRETALLYQNSYTPCLEGKIESIRKLQPK